MRPRNLRRALALRGLWLALLVWTARVDAGQSEAALSLAGPWRVELDPRNAGENERWYTRALAHPTRLPGSLAENGFGDEISAATKWTGGIVDKSWFTAPEYARYRQPGNVKVPFWLTPAKSYVGAAWYQREVEVPAAWQGRRITLTLERCHWETRVWADDQEAGMQNSLSTPHIHDLSRLLTPGKHRLTLRVDNTVKINVGENAHSVSDHTQGNWNGVVGELRLSAGSPVWIDDLQVYPDVARKAVRLKLSAGNATGSPVKAVLRFQVRGAGKRLAREPAAQSLSLEVAAGGGGADLDYPLGPEARTWDEFSPALYQLTARLETTNSGVSLSDERTVAFGLRELGREGTQFTVNGRRTFLRGTLECCIFPLTGYPPTDKPAWERIIRVCKAHGLNHIRFHSWCPPEAAFAAADELGFYYHVECAAWADVDDPAFDQFLYAESDRIVRAYGNHPSFCLFVYGNEPGGKTQNRFLGDWVKHWKARDSRRLYTSGAGWPNLPENDYQSSPAPRVQAWGGGLRSRINARPPETVTDYADFIGKFQVPVVSHEIGQWCVYPNLREIPKYTGVFKARNFEIFRDSLSAHDMLEQADAFLRASGKLQALCYKEDIESALRTPGMGGFQLLDLHDFPGQGTALVGVLDPFWDSKGYIAPAEYRRFACETVPLALLEKRVLTAGEELKARVKIAHFGPAPLVNAQVTWKLAGAGGRAVRSGAFPKQTIPIGNDAMLGEITVPLAGLTNAEELRLTVAVAGTGFANDWDLWVYPAEVTNPAPSPEVTVARSLDPDTVATLEKGGSVLLLMPPRRVKGDRLGPVALGFSSIFWNTAWTARQAPHTLGILCNPKHPALAGFPTEEHTNWQWWYLLHSARPMILNDFPAGLRPIVQVIDDWFTNRRLGLLFEARIGRGKLMVCSMDLAETGQANPVARQMLDSLRRYMAGPAFRPGTDLSVAQVQALVAPVPALERLGARVARTDSAEPGHEGEKAIDGDPSTMWHTAYSGQTPGHPHELVLEFKTPTVLRGFTLLPRQDGNHNGWINGYVCHVGDDPANWGAPAAEGALNNDDQLKQVRFDQPRRGRFFRLVATSGFGPGPWSSIAELDVLEEGR